MSRICGVAGQEGGIRDEVVIWIMRYYLDLISGLFAFSVTIAAIAITILCLLKTLRMIG